MLKLHHQHLNKTQGEKRICLLRKIRGGFFESLQTKHNRLHFKNKGKQNNSPTIKFQFFSVLAFKLSSEYSLALYYKVMLLQYLTSTSNFFSVASLSTASNDVLQNVNICFQELSKENLLLLFCLNT